MSRFGTIDDAEFEARRAALDAAEPPKGTPAWEVWEARWAELVDARYGPGSYMHVLKCQDMIRFLRRLRGR